MCEECGFGHSDGNFESQLPVGSEGKAYGEDSRYRKVLCVKGMMLDEA